MPGTVTLRYTRRMVGNHDMFFISFRFISKIFGSSDKFEIFHLLTLYFLIAFIQEKTNKTLN